MSWGKWGKSFFVASAAHCRLEGWKRWFHCTGARFRESETFASQLYWDFSFRVVCFRGVEPRCYSGICNAERLLRSSLLREVSCKMFVLEVWIVTFCESLVENARFGSLDCHFWWKSRGKCSFWKLGLSLLVKVSWKMLVLEAWIIECRVKSVQQECQARMSSRSVPQDSQARVSSKECPARVFSKSVLSRVSRRSVKQECPARVSSKGVLSRVSCRSAKQERRVSRKGDDQECQERVSSKSVLSRVSSKSVQQQCLARLSCQECKVSSKSVK